jgi:hypothetical protein
MRQLWTRASCRRLFLGAVYLLAQPTNDPRPCSDAPGFGTGTDRPGYFEIVLLHEILHAIGFTPHCALTQAPTGIATMSMTAQPT